MSLQFWVGWPLLHPSWWTRLSVITIAEIYEVLFTRPKDVQTVFRTRPEIRQCWWVTVDGERSRGSGLRHWNVCPFGIGASQPVSEDQIFKPGCMGGGSWRGTEEQERGQICGWKGGFRSQWGFWILGASEGGWGLGWCAARAWCRTPVEFSPTEACLCFCWVLQTPLQYSKQEIRKAWIRFLPLI